MAIRHRRGRSAAQNDELTARFEHDAQNSELYDVGALHGAEGDQYVLRLTESETVLGRVKTAERVSVTLEDSNDTRAAVSGALSGQDEIIVSSSKSIYDGDRVRLEEPQP